MPTYRLQTSLQDDSGLPRDQYVTTTHVAYAAAPTLVQLSNACGAVSAFFQDIKSYLSPVISQGIHTTKAYLLGAPIGTPPAQTLLWELLPPPVGDALPGEVACCLTYHASPQAGVRRQSWRGRFYIGPLNTSTVHAGPSVARPNDTFRQAVVDAALDMGNAFNIDGKWVVASKVLQQIFPIATVSVDDAWDTQRSRGNRPTGRIVGVLPGGGGASGPW